MTSPLLDLPEAVAGDGIDAAVAAHYGSFNVEQRRLAAGEGFVDLSHRDVFEVVGPDRLDWLHSLSTQDFESLAPGVWTRALVLSPQGHIEHEFTGFDDGERFVAHAEPGAAAALLEWLDRMRFLLQVEVAARPDRAVCWRPTPDDRVGISGGKFDLIPRSDLAAYAEAAGPAAGLWAYEALRIARGEPRMGFETDARALPNELGWLPPAPHAAVHLDKGCYRGQETVARVHTLGRPPRRLVMLHLDGSENRLPEHGAQVSVGGRPVGFLGSAARHYELGPIALALVKRNVPTDVPLEVAGLVAAQEVVVDPDVGLHFRPRFAGPS